MIARAAGRRVTEFMFHVRRQLPDTEKQATVVQSERLGGRFQVDVSLVGGAASDKDSYVPPAQGTQDPIASRCFRCALAACALFAGHLQSFVPLHAPADPSTRARTASSSYAKGL